MLVIIHFTVFRHDAAFGNDFRRFIRTAERIEVRAETGDHRSQHPLGKRIQLAVEAHFDLGDCTAVQVCSAEAGEETGEFLIAGIQTIGHALVDHAGGDAFFKVGNHLFSSAFCRVEVGFLGVGAQVGEHDIRDVRNGLFAGGIFGIHVVAEEQFFFRFDAADGVFINDPGACAVDEHGALLHE